MDEIENLRCRRLQHAILKRAFDDLRDLLNHTSIEHDDEDRPLNREERAALLDETIDFFLGSGRSTCSLDALCDSLDLDAERIDPNAWKWADLNPTAAANANDAVNLFSGTANPNKMTIVGPSSSGYESEIINGVPSQNIPGYLNGNGSPLGQLNGSQLENMALVAYGGYLLKCNNGLKCILNSQYYIPQCLAPGVQGTKKQGKQIVYLTCSTAWQWVPNSVNQASGLNYVQNGIDGVRDQLQQ